MNISLTGVKGTGKTTVARLLAEKSGKRLISTDSEFVKKSRLRQATYVKKHGWEKYRTLESEVIEKLSEYDDCIFDTGSGIVLRNENINNLKKSGIVVLMTSDLRTIASRIKNGKIKMDITPKKYLDNVKKVLEECEDRYRMAADYVIDTSNLSPEEVCELIMHYVQMELH
jgi:shikimate kinase